ncbi:hypothetical protein [Rickettsia bellii]|uniref:Uncharacterized protein n=2 Tax=Rickettsia bellii TaxID=33990 RepID=Q1RJP4_RICBR|nr:hypothetical protein [Rickettsia bellii]ABE04420.1 unknown [Rickettsia bellii RML369-C]ABV79536.1 hypothetical protein A1I_06080 [Rickettsia bellii OSU 85-389]
MTTTFQLIQESNFTEAVKELTRENVNERGDIVFTLNFNNKQFSYAAKNVNTLEALCFMNSVLSLTSTSQQQLKDRLNILKSCIKTAYNKMHEYDNAIWNGRDDNNNSTAIWLAWGGVSEKLKDLLDKHPNLIEDEQELIRNAFDVTMEVGHLNIEQKIELAKVLIPLGIQINNLNTYNIILQNENYLAAFKNIIEDASNLSSEIFSKFVDNVISKIGILISNSKAQKIDNSIIKNAITKCYEIIEQIFKHEEKINIKDTLEKDLSTSNTYVSPFLHWLLELGNNNLTSILQNYDQNKKFDFYVKDWNGKEAYRSALEWIANYRFDILNNEVFKPYLNPSKKQENEKILINLVSNGSKVNDTKQIAPFFKELLEHRPPLFNNNLNNTKQAICNKMFQESVNAKKISSEIYTDQTLDFASCLIAIQQFEKEIVDSLGVANLNPYD